MYQAAFTKTESHSISFTPVIALPRFLHVTFSHKAPTVLQHKAPVLSDTLQCVW